MATPIQRQYWKLKKENPDAILFFRLGDFYELFYEDALVGSKCLGITLTARHKDTESQMPMCGFPYHQYEVYLEKLIDKGYKVAIAEQVEDEDGKITRKVQRLITPGTTLESKNLLPEAPNYLASVFLNKKQFTIAYTDISTGELRTCLLENEKEFLEELFKINPRELLLSPENFSDEDFVQKLPKSLLTPRKFPPLNQTVSFLQSHFPPNHLDVSGIGKIQSVMICVNHLLEYAQDTQQNDLQHINKIDYYCPDETMVLDTQTLNHLEIFNAFDPTEEKGTLWSIFEKAKTSMGARELRSWILRPLLAVDTINERLDAVEYTLHNFEFKDNLERILSDIPDIERLLSRMVNHQGTPRDLGCFRDFLSLYPSMKSLLENSENAIFKNHASLFSGFEDLYKKLESSLVSSPPLEITQGGIFVSSFDPKLEELRSICSKSDIFIEDIIAKTKSETGISTIKLKYSKNFGFCLEIPTSQISKVPNDWIRRQTLVNAERYTNDQLSEYESKVLNAQSLAYDLEEKAFKAMREELLEFTQKFQYSARVIAQIDALLTLARTSETQRWVRPSISHEGQDLYVEKGRHPVVENQDIECFIPNDLSMNQDKSRFHLISGPNMAGKSTFLRQNALIVLLGQIGSFVPASSARWGIIDRIFTRIGASDNLAAGKSTFFVEMSESSSILHQATERSFIILDEVGRGTSTFDGLSLAWAISEYLHDKLKSKVLFATHYHELIDFVENLSAGKNYHVSVTHTEKGIVFLRSVKEGGILDSFGIDVARIAGIPEVIIKKAQEVLQKLESGVSNDSQPNLFQAPKLPKSINKDLPKNESLFKKIIQEVDPDTLSPRDALGILYKIKKDFDDLKDK